MNEFFNWQIEAMDLQWIQKENELAQEKADLKKTAALFKQVIGSYSLRWTLVEFFSQSLDIKDFCC